MNGREFWRRYVWNPSRVEARAITSVPWSVGDDLSRPNTVTFDRAVSFGAVFSAWRYLADQIATLPLHAYRDLGDRRQRMQSLPQLFQQPAVEGTLVDWVFRAVVSMASRGNAVGLVTSRDGFGFPTGVEWLDPDEIRCDDRPPSGSPQRPVWYWQGRRLPSEDVVHIPWFPVPGRVWGLSPMAAYAATVNAALGAQSYASDWHTGGGVPPGTFANSDKEIVSETEAQTIKARLVTSIRTHQPIVYGKGWTFTPISIAPHEASFIETQKLSANQIAAIYGVPPEKIGGEAGGSLTYNTVELNQLAMQTDAVRPWAVKLEAKFAQLLPERQYVRLNMDAPLRTDLLSRMQVAEISRRIGYQSIDELREINDLEPIPNGQGSTFTPQPLLEKGIGSVPKAGAMPPAPAPAGEIGRPRLVPVEEDGQGQG